MPTLELNPTHKAVVASRADIFLYLYALLHHPDYRTRYRVQRDEHDNITSDPNRKDDEEYIVCLIGQVIIVSLETDRTVKALPRIG